MTKINKPKTETPNTIDMNDYNYLYDMLETEKSLSINMVNLLNELSNENLFNKIEPMFMEIKKAQRTLFELLFSNGWYTLEEAEGKKINEKVSQLQPKLDELNN